MNHRSRSSRFLPIVVVVLGVLLALPFAVDAWAQEEDEKELGWSFSANLSGVWTGGNSQSSTYGLLATVKHAWPKSDLRFDFGGTQTESSLRTRTAVGTSDADFTVEENTVTEKTAELFFARGRYDYQLHKRFLVFGGVDWLRNTFAGIDSRTLLALGAGNTWKNNKKVRFITDYSFTYTFQSDVVENPFISHNFPGIRLGYDFWIQMSESTQFESILIADFNLDNTDDIRLDWVNSLPVAINDWMQLKPSLQLLWRNDPSLTEVTLVDSNGDPVDPGTVLVPLEELDALFTLALVFNF
jgi:putative salt-induced outer membrane protein YdiY